MTQHQYGAPTHCICPQCGFKRFKDRGHPCMWQVCPKCGANMMRFDELAKPPVKERRKE